MHPARMPYRMCAPARPGWSTIHARRRCAPRAALRKLAGTCSRPPVGAGSSRLDRRTRHTVASASVKWLELPLRHTRERVPAKLPARFARSERSVRAFGEPRVQHAVIGIPNPDSPSFDPVISDGTIRKPFSKFGQRDSKVSLMYSKSKQSDPKVSRRHPNLTPKRPQSAPK